MSQLLYVYTTMLYRDPKVNCSFRTWKQVTPLATWLNSPSACTGLHITTASVAQVGKRNHLESGEASLLRYARRSSILHIWGLFQTINSLQAKAILQEYLELTLHMNSSKRTPNSLVSQCARLHGFGKSRSVMVGRAMDRAYHMAQVGQYKVQDPTCATRSNVPMGRQNIGP